MKTQLYRSRTDTMLGGVCGGFGAYLGVDPLWIRLFFVLLTIGGGSGVLIYLICWLIIPLESSEEGEPVAPTALTAEELSTRARAIGDELRAAAAAPHPQAPIFIGAAMLIIGVVYLLQNLGVYWLAWLNPSTLWPLLLVIGGIALMLRRRQGAQV